MDVSEDSSSNYNISDSSSDNDYCFEGYVAEPEYTQAELDSMNFDDGSDSESSSEEDIDSSRLENMHWCTCQECSIMPSLIESKCCRETISLLNDKLESIK